MTLNKLTEYTANQTQKEIERHQMEQASRRFMRPEPQPQPIQQPIAQPTPAPQPPKPVQTQPWPAPVKEKKKRRWHKNLAWVMLGLIIGMLIISLIIGPMIMKGAVTEASKEYYAQGVAFVINQIAEKEAIPYFSENEIKWRAIE